MPMAPASPITLASTWRRVAPSERSMANSRTALGHGDREGVEDDEGADDHGHAAEGQQDGAQHVADGVADRLGVVGDRLGADVFTSA